MYTHNTEFFPRPHERAEWWKRNLTSSFPKGLVTTLMLQALPTARIYHWLKHSAGRDRGGENFGTPEAIDRAWTEYNSPNS